MILAAEAKQFRLNDKGQVLYQPDVTNPLPGQPVAFLAKGSALLLPCAHVIAESEAVAGQDAAGVAAKIDDWLKAHIKTVLEPLIALENEEGVNDPVLSISRKVRESLGIIPRADLEEMIKSLDPDARRVLRQKQIRLGPVLVFMPLLNKPAAVRLRALLWNIWHGKELPASVPADGMVSMPVAADADSLFFRAIGYPVYGPRAIRIDMLDRVISAVYDGSKDGQFKAKHEMAEWLGCSIPDLYAVLEAMGHKKIHDPADQPLEQKIEPAEPLASPDVLVPETEVKAESIGVVDAATPVPTPPVKAEKPELATFRLRRGKAYGGENGGEGRPARPPRKEKPAFRNEDKPRRDDKKPRHKPRNKDRDRDDDRDNGPRRYVSAAPKTKPEDSPFAVLQNLKARSGGN